MNGIELSAKFKLDVSLAGLNPNGRQEAKLLSACILEAARLVASGSTGIAVYFSHSYQAVSAVLAAAMEARNFGDYMRRDYFESVLDSLDERAMCFVTPSFAAARYQLEQGGTALSAGRRHEV